MLLPILIAVMAAAGWAIGRMRPQVNPLFAVLAVFAALTAQGGLDMAFLDGGLDQIFGDPRREATEFATIAIAAGEAAGFWLAIVLVPWAKFSARALGGVYALAAEVVAAIYHYFPFDLVVIPAAILSQDAPPYLLAPVLCAPIAAVPLFAGLMQARTAVDDDVEIRLPE